MATFIEIQDNGQAKHLINISQVRNIKASTNYCTVYLIDDKQITAKHTYQQMKEAINSASIAPDTIYSIVDDSTPDAVASEGLRASTPSPIKKSSF